MAHIWQQITKEVFARVFKEIWLDTIKTKINHECFPWIRDIILSMCQGQASKLLLQKFSVIYRSKEVTTSKHSATLEAAKKNKKESC